ncbi:MAG: 6,7-dimethyl-8-ribityllumazine synthase [Salibacteraceae bacterium]|jgi:6,7-dimethyl-8-ribityllumazine synthase|nr:6,7-dimethyl-8-ribityllumazine synthase [Salibacteraceae bacterium]MDP4685819.1 6,7-dimethyl-8-ribityllumazine synthase [Salibacteraceae bacterium]MDP4763994.1 6,7-dimethyl-8-ribityllumazine synthase [Salibacteraceae bacterium]MDP4843752.1 6,7-dimethyl-8-ribityllumazine synthase [Salibacteraceae bacterium]MDP4964139.1 6,7-dimethyl-8-ribityllumazine synthase [Salibacteraceae bacterium]
MATENKNLSDLGNLPKVNADWTIVVVKSAWNEEITTGLYNGAIATLKSAGMADDKIKTMIVPGSFELPLGAQWGIEKYEADAVICLGSVIRGETAHFDYVCQAVSSGVKDVSLHYNVPVIFGVLTDDNIEQSRARSGGKHGNKGDEAAATALLMLQLRDQD